MELHQSNENHSICIMKMDESGKKYVRFREPPSIPFLWEVKPGFPKKDWKPEPSCSSVLPQIPLTPIRYIASVPFAWEEKPGKPIPGFSYNSLESMAPNLEAKASSSSSSGSRYSGTCKYGCYCDDDNDKGSSSDSESTISMELEAFSFETDESFSSGSSLLANCLVPSSKLSTAIPLQKNPLTEQNSDHLETFSSPASNSGSSTSSYETGRSSLVGASFLETLFPLMPPNSGFLQKAAGYSENTSSTTPLELNETDLDGEDNTSVMMRRPPTLGELIMMSRRRSYRMKATQTRNWDLSRNITTKKAFGCCMFATSGNMTEGLMKRKYIPRLKLV